MKPTSVIGRLTEADVSRIIAMAWEDRTSFEAIRLQFELTPGEVIKLMRRELQSSSFRMWRKRTAGRTTKHESIFANSVNERGRHRSA